MINRDDEYNPLLASISQIKGLRLLADSASDALAANASALVGLNKSYLAASQKVNPFSNPQPADYIAFGQAEIALQAEQAKSPALQATAMQAVLDFRNAWMKGNNLFQALLQDPGMQEVV